MIPSLPFATVSDIAAFAVVLGRMGGLFSAIPMFGGKAVPVRIKAVTIMMMTLLLFPLVRSKVPTLNLDVVSLGILVARETLIGLTLGLFTQIIFAGIEFCGQLVSTQMGLSIATQFDPTMGGQFTSLAVLQNLMAMLLFLSLGVHHLFFSALVESYQIIPVGNWRVNEDLLKFISGQVGQVFIIGVKLAAPVMVALLATTVVLGIMARAFPQMNVFIVSLPLNIGLGFFFLGISLMAFLRTIQRSYEGIWPQLQSIFKLFS